MVEELRLLIPRDLRYLGVVRRAVTAVAERCGFKPGAIAQIEMAVDEACANAVRHGCPQADRIDDGAGSDALEVEIVADEGGVTVMVCESAEPITMRLQDQSEEGVARPAPFSCPQDLEAWFASPEAHGLGLFVIERFMDEVEWQGDAEHGHRLRLRKRLALQQA